MDGLFNENIASGEASKALVAAYNHAKLTETINRLLEAALSSGASRMTLDEINVEILESRKERKLLHL